MSLTKTETKVVKRYIDWSFVESAVDRLAINIVKSSIDIKVIVGLPRGGLVPAVMLSHKLNIPYSNFEDDFSFEGEEKVLVVDDICDSGETLEHFQEFPDYCYTATIHYKTTASVEPNFWFRLVSNNEWIVYPWENKDSNTIQDYKINKNGT